MAEATRTVTEPRRRGMHDVVMVILAAALIITPSFVSSILTDRLNIDIRIVGVGALAMFVVGVWLLTKVVRA